MEKSVHKKLNELQSTAISGNDISSSCLYVSALTVMYAGQFAWISLLVVAVVLFLFRKIYGEVVGALPLNGGAYNVLLNTSSKKVASVAAALTVLSYMATAVISASEAMHYLDHLIPVNVMLATVVVLGIFTLLTIMGISESAIVAVVIFITHLAALSLLLITGIVFVLGNGLDVFELNWSLPVKGGSLLTALFLGFSAAMLGISGFESSANFVEEQKHGVFPKTLRNMVIFIIPVADVQEHSSALLAYLGSKTGGSWLATIISIDAVLVLCGAVLTSFVGVLGLVNRMTLDRILPNYFLKTNKKGSFYRIAIGFLILCVSVLFATKGDLASLAGVYTFSFLSVMALFGIGNLLLKIKRRKLPRPERATVLNVLIAVSFVVLAFFGNILLNKAAFYTFLQYLTIIISALISGLEAFSRPFRKFFVRSNRYLRRLNRNIHSQEFVFFTKKDDVAIMNKVMQYVQNNETTKKLKVVNVFRAGDDNGDLKSDLRVLDRAYPEIDIEFIEIPGEFTPQLIDELSRHWNIPKNFMFIASPSDRFSYRVADLGGVRLIM